MELIYWLVFKPVLVLVLFQVTGCRPSDVTTHQASWTLNSSETAPPETTTARGVCDNMDSSGYSKRTVFFPGDTFTLSCLCYQTRPYRYDGVSVSCPHWTILEGADLVDEVKMESIRGTTGCQTDKTLLVRSDLDMDTYRLLMRCSAAGSTLEANFQISIQGGPASGKGVVADHRVLFYCLISMAFILFFAFSFIGIFCRRYRRRRRRGSRAWNRRIQTPNFDGCDNPVSTVSEGVIQDRPPPYQENVLPPKPFTPPGYSNEHPAIPSPTETCDLSILPPKWSAPVSTAP